MNYQDWINLFGRDSEDKAVKDLLAERGVMKVPPIKKDHLNTRVPLDDSMLIFGAAELFPSRSSGGDGACVLSALVLPLKGYKWGEYKGELPHQLKPTDTQKALRKRFGKPRECDEDFYWDEWVIDGLDLRVTYAEDYKSLAAVSLTLPTEV
jgi:hypothetical protein